MDRMQDRTTLSPAHRRIFLSPSCVCAHIGHLDQNALLTLQQTAGDASEAEAELSKIAGR